MNRAPVALFALLCTLASSMVAAGVASDRPATAGKPQRINGKSDVTTISYSGSHQDNWLAEPNWQAIDVQRAIALPTKKIPTRIPEKVKPVAAIIITIEQAPEVAKPLVAKAVATKQNAAISQNAAKIQSQQAAKGAAAVMSVVNKMVAASKAAPIQPRVTASFSSTTYVPTSNVRSVLPTNRIAVADLHLHSPAVATTNGVVTALPITPVAKKANSTATVALNGGKLQIAYGSLSMISVGGKSFTASPYIADNATSILLNKGTSTTSNSAKTQKSGNSFSVWTWGGAQLARLQDVIAGSIGEIGDRLSGQVNNAATGYIGQIQSFTAAQWFPMLNTEYAPAIKSAQLKTGDTK